MSLDLSVKQNISSSGITATGTAGNAQASTPINVPIGQSENVGSNDVSVNTSNTEQNQPQTIRTRQQLLDSLKFLQGYGISQEEGIQILCAMGFNTNETILLNLDQKAFNGQIKILMDTITALKEDKIEVTKENLEYHAGKFAAQINCGYDSVASFRGKSHESLTDKLKRAYGDKFLTGKTEDLIKGIEAYYTEIDGATDISDFSKLLYYSSDEEIIALYNAIPLLEENDKLKGVVAAIKSCSTPAMRSKLVSNHELNQKIMTSIDKDGESWSQDEMIEYTSGIATYRNYEDAIEYNKDTVDNTKEFFAQKGIQEKIENVLKKYNNEEILTQEEQELLNLYNSIIAEPTGQFIGYSNSNVLSKDEKYSVVSDLNKGVYETPIYREIMQNVNEYVESHPEALAMSKDDFIKLMDEVTSGNYTTVVNDVANGTVTELAEPKATITNTSSNQVDTEPNVTQGSLGFEGKSVSNIVNCSENNIQNLYKAQVEKDSSIVAIEEKDSKADSNGNIVNTIRKCGVKGFYNFVESNGAFKTVLEVYNNLGNITNQGVLTFTEKLYAMLNPARQENVLRQIDSASGFNTLLAQTSDQVVLNLDGNFTSFYTNQQVEKAKEKAQQKMQHGLA